MVNSQESYAGATNFDLSGSEEYTSISLTDAMPMQPAKEKVVRINTSGTSNSIFFKINLKRAKYLESKKYFKTKLKKRMKILIYKSIYIQYHYSDF